jgi:hypothetical protein
MTATSDQIKDIGEVRYRPVNRCIYCGVTGVLEDEHIIPLGLNGTAVLPKASCRSCAKVTGHFEQKVLRGPMRPFRVFHRLKSRTKHKDAPKTLRLPIVRNGKAEIVDQPIDNYPIVLRFPCFTPPAILDPNGYTHGIRVSSVINVLPGPHPEAVARSLGATEIKIETKECPAEFARMLAKIGLGMAVAEGFADRLDGEPFVIPSILGLAEDVGRWVGTLKTPNEAYPGLQHRVFLHCDFERRFLIAEVQLFSNWRTPSYVVIIGKLQD